MEKLRTLNRTVDISEPILAEDSTFSALALSLSAVLEQLDENAKHHDYLVALLLVLLAESGFSVSSALDIPKWERNTRLVYIPTNWKSEETGVYEIYLTLRCNIDCIRSKLIVIAYGDKLILNILSRAEDTKVYSMVIQTLKYVNPYTNNLCLRYMNLKEISHRFKDKLVIPLRRDLLLASNLMGPSLENLPIELRLKIANMLSQQELRCLSICSKTLHEFYSEILIASHDIEKFIKFRFEMNAIMTEEERKILHFLKSQGCCLRCCFRFVGYRTSECYCKPFEFAVQQSFADIREDTSVEEQPCVACLGVLQDKTQENIVTKIAEKVKEKDYDCTTFTCALTVPVSTKLREHILYAYMHKEIDIDESVLNSLRLRLQSVKDIWKSFMIPQLEQAMGKYADLSTPSPFLIEIFLAYANDEVIFKELTNKYKGGNGKQKKRKCNNKFSRKDVDTLLTEMTDEQLMRHFTISQITPKTFIHVDDILCSHSSIFIGGRYNKLSRKLSQTPWFINGEKKVETSVQDLLCNPITEIVKAESIKFLSSGREDVDVRNIYGGRPFAVELLNPRMTNITSELLMHLTDSINQSTKQVQITSSLKVLSRFDLKKLKEGENVKTKFYRALCVCRGASRDLPQLEHLNKLENVTIIQRTPVRVLHRRPLSPRTRIIYKMRARWAKPHELKELLHTAAESTDAFFVLDVKTQAGTYVKEFVHGDFGRTKPSLCDFLNAEVDIVALDVTGINLKWP